MRDYIKELYANIHMRDSISGEGLLQILNKVAPWDMEYDGKLETI